MPLPNLPAETLYDFIVGDFEDAWAALAATRGPLHRGNFMFSRQAMTLLEFAGRLCNADQSGAALRDLSTELERIEPRYFTSLPGPCLGAGDEYELPSSVAAARENQLLWALFNVIRHGQAHQYQQMAVELTDGRHLLVSLTGAQHGMVLNPALPHGRPVQHLGYTVLSDGDVAITVCPDVLFLDIKAAVERSGLLGRGLTLTYLKPRGKTHFQFDAVAVAAALNVGGHAQVPGA